LRPSLLFASVPAGAGTLIAAGDLEKYAYCPLSWWLSRGAVAESSPTLETGVENHLAMGEDLTAIVGHETKAHQAERLVLYSAIVATFVAILGVDLLPFPQEEVVSEILGVLALIWLLAASFFLYRATRTGLGSKVAEYERIILVFAMAAVLIAVNALAFGFVEQTLARVLEAVALIWLVTATFFFHRSVESDRNARLLRSVRKVAGKILYVGSDRAPLLEAPKAGLAGRPDYVLQVGEDHIPVEEKTGRVPRGPLFSHLLQLAAYCAITEEVYGRSVPFGLLRYGSVEHEIDFDADLRRTLRTKLDEMQATLDGRREAHRNHAREGKCLNCSRRPICPERLA